MLASGSPFAAPHQGRGLTPCVAGHPGGIGRRVLGSRRNGEGQPEKNQYEEGHTFPTAGPKARFHDTARFSNVRRPSTMNSALIATSAAATTGRDMCGSAGVSAARMPSETYTRGLTRTST